MKNTLQEQSTISLNHSLENLKRTSVNRFIRKLQKVKRKNQPGIEIQWELPITETCNLTTLEVEQLLGLISGVHTITEHKENNRSAISAKAFLKKEVFTFLLLWPLSCLEDSNRMLNALFTMSKYPFLNDMIHFIGLPPNDEPSETWLKNIEVLLKSLKKDASHFKLGLYLTTVPKSNSDYIKSMTQLSRTLEQFNIESHLVALLVNTNPTIDDSENIINFAKQHNLQYDFSLQQNEKMSAMQPYYKSSAYHPLSFDLRAPNYSDQEIFLTEIPRFILPPSLLNNEMSRVGFLRKKIFYNELSQNQNQKAKTRIKQILNRDIQNNFKNIVSLEENLMVHWPKYHVYNWAPTATHFFYPIELNALELTSDTSPFLKTVKNNFFKNKLTPLFSATEFLSEVCQHFQIAKSLTVNELLTEQHDAHGYLYDGNRPGASKDSLELVKILPTHLGPTLEIGGGFGVLAKIIHERASSYIIIDSDIKSGIAVNDLGTQGITADMHNLPLCSNQFDTVIADNIIEHAYNPLKVLNELYRVLNDNGQIYALIPCDLLTNEYQLKTHLWKADYFSIKKAFEIAGFHIVSQKILHYQRIGADGAFPSCLGQTCLIHAKKIEKFEKENS